MAEDKKVKITGEVQIDTGKAEADVNSLKGEFTEFKAELAKITAGITLILRSLAGMAKGMDATAADAQEISKATEDLAEETQAAAVATDKLSTEMKEASVAADDASEATEEVGAKAEIARGIFQRIGHTIVDGLVSGLAGAAKYLISFLGNAGKFEAVFDEMATRGVKDVDKLKVAVVELAGAMGEDLLDVAKSVNLAESLGAGDGALEAARAAWENYRVTGMDVNRQIEISTRLSRSFNMEMGEQAELIRQVAQASQEARVNQEMMWNGMSSMGPRIRQLGGSFEDLVKITTAGLSEGVKAEEEGLQGLNELLSSLIAPSDEFGKKLAELGVIATESSPQWKQLTAEVAAQSREFEALNAELNTYKRETAEIGLMTTQAERAIKQFSDLNAKREAGTRLNRLERQAYRELQGDIANLNKELSAYDKAGNIVANGEFRRLGTIDQLRDRIVAAKSAQEELNIASQEAQLDAQSMGSSLQGLNGQLTVVANAMRTEIPAAIKAAISEGGMPQFIQTLSSVPEALAPLSAEVKTLVAVIGQSFGGLNTQAQTTGGAILGLGGQFQMLHQRGTDAIARLLESFGTLATMIISPISEAMNAVAQMISEKLSEPFSDGSTVYQKIAAWSTGVAAAIVTDIEAVASGDQALGEVLGRWFARALESVKAVWAQYAQPLLDEMKLALEARMPEVRSWLINQFGQMMRDAIASAFDLVGAPLQDFFYNQMTSQGNTNRLNAYMGGMSGDPNGTVYGGGATANSMAAGSTTINVNGAGDPKAVADEVIRRQSQLERLGYSGARLR